MIPKQNSIDEIAQRFMQNNRELVSRRKICLFFYGWVTYVPVPGSQHLHPLAINILSKGGGYANEFDNEFP